MNRDTVVVAMSGGVDSSVTAALLREQGFDVIGVTMQVWPRMTPAEEERHGGCCGWSAVSDARRVANMLDIPYYVLNMREEFERSVINYFAAEYARGRTPNPCIACNQFIKFDALLRKALALDAWYVATGHYARVVHDDEAGRFRLFRSRDPRKDQTYALYNLTQQQLEHILFPLGEFDKDETRRLAAELGLPVAEKPDSQEICFVKDDDYAEFLRERIPENFVPGPIVDTQGNVLGEHEGLPNYTYGQRKGLGITAPERLYVVDIRPESNTLVVGTADETRAPGLIATDINLIAQEKLLPGTPAQVKIRYNSPPRPAVLDPVNDDRVRVLFDHPPRAIAPGQSAVFYDGDEVLGGGVIDDVLSVIDLEEDQKRHVPVTT